MCGIAGIYGKNGLSKQAQVKLDRARKSLKSRGPDSSGTFIHPQVGLVHTRLAILDLHSGQQPWRETKSNITLIFNGEIYNFSALRNELIAKNHHFIGHSDTEVLAKAYLEWGLDCIEHLRGMFAFAILDPNLDRLWLVRDRLGVKPLYYHYSAEKASFSFASNVATLLTMDCTHPEWDRTAVAHYLMTTRTHMADRTLLRAFLQCNPEKHCS